MKSGKTQPPIGYVRGQKGRWRKDPNPRLRKPIPPIFDKFRELGSVGPVHQRYLSLASWLDIQRRLTTNSRKRKLAILYLRTATEGGNTEAIKRSLMSLALYFGWDRDRILVIDERRASGVSDRRPGFQRMLRLIDAGEVGLVIVSDVSRISRDAAQMSEFFAKARAAGVSVLTSDGIVG